MKKSQAQIRRHISNSEKHAETGEGTLEHLVTRILLLLLLLLLELTDRVKLNESHDL